MKRGQRIFSRRRLLMGAGVAALAGISSYLTRKGGDMENTFKTTSKRQPVIFVGHGNPMFAIEKNSFTDHLVNLGKTVGKPKAILMISAHWLSAGTWVTRMDQPKTIHDFGGFPQALFDVQYPAKGHPQLAEQIQNRIDRPKVQGDDGGWGLDHGAWSVLKHMYPAADVPVVQLSIDMSEPPEFHLELGKKLGSLRDEGVLIIGSGNIVHNLRRANWNQPWQGEDWAIEFDVWVKEKMIKGDFNSIANDFQKTAAGRLSVPTPDHYYPLLYTLGAVDADKDPLRFTFEGYDMGSISMRTLQFG